MKVENIVLTAFLALFVAFLIWIVVSMCANEAMKDAGKRALRMQAPVEDSFLGNPIYATFERGEYANVSEVTYKDKVRNFNDLNKSKIIGNVIGEKTREGLNGFWKGFTRKGKHSPGEDDKHSIEE